jgi:hypothetical protein
MAPVSRPQEVVFFQGPQVTITGDVRAFPLMVADTNGEVDVATFDPYFEWRNQWIAYAASRGVKLIQISITNTAKPPSATVRKHIADRVSDDAKLAAFGGTYMVVPSALMRGVVTAVMWVMGSSEVVKNFGTLADAADAASRYFADAGIEAPTFDAQNYKVPTK